MQIQAETSNLQDLHDLTLHSLSQGQISVWVAQMLDPNDPCYNIGECVEISGSVEIAVFEKALRQVVASADALHLRFIETEKGPRQYFSYDPDWIMPNIDVMLEADPEAAAQAWMHKDMALAFDLRRGPLFRYALLRVGHDRFFWYAVNHHLINDGVGWSLILRRVARVYTALMDGQTHPEEVLGSWLGLLDEQTEYQGSVQNSRDAEYWRTQLIDRPAAITLSGKPSGRAVGFVSSVGWIPRQIDLERLGRAHDASVASVITAAAAVYLYRMTGARDVILGTQVAARVGRVARQAVGLSANAVPLRLSIDPEDTFGNLLKQAARQMRGALRHQRYRTEDLRRALGLGPLDADICSAFVNFTPLDESSTFAGSEIRRRPLGNWRVDDFQLVYYGGSEGSGLRIDMIANPAHYSVDALDEHQRRFSALVSQLASTPDKSLRSIDGLTDREREQVLHGFNATATNYPREKLIHQLFEEQVLRSPDAVAAIYGERSLTYSELNRRANQIAHLLNDRGVRSDIPVAICVERSLEMVAGLLGILKAGGAFVPIDPSYPKERIAFMLHDSNPHVLLTQAALCPDLPQTETAVLALDRDESLFERYSAANPDPVALSLTSRNLAYVIYTSGSTGVPKGVMNEHRGVVNRLLWMQDEYQLDSSQRVLQKTPFSFDVSVWEFFWPLLAGACLVEARPHGHQDPEYIKQTIREFGITTIHFVPSMLQTFLDQPGLESCSALRRIICSGEELSAALQNRCIENLPHARLHNLYGPTEAAIDVTHWDCRLDIALNRVPIGRPIANTQIYVLDAYLQPAPIGVSGEIYIGGAGVARGYINRPDLTDERFIRSPFGLDSEARLYKTGDIGRWRADGNVEYLGRNDDQIKIRGFRIEPGEIEAALTRQPLIREAIVTMRGGGSGDRQLIAFLTRSNSESARGELDAEALRKALHETLPDYMLPNMFVALDAFPLTPSGKVDRRALSAMDLSKTAGESRSVIAPRSLTEEALREIWRDTLQIETVNRADDFFELGGHSLLATQVMSRVRNVFQLDLPLSVLFEARTLEALAVRVDETLREQRHAPRAPLIEAATDEGPAPLSFSQQRMWMIQSLDPENTAYNMAGAVRIRGPLNVQALSAALDDVKRRHDNLRSVFKVVDERALQHVEPWESQALTAIDLRGQGDEAWAEALRQAELEARTPIDLTHGPVMRAKLFRTGEEEYLFQMTLHHISGDQWSVGVLGRELAASYSNLLAGRPSRLQPLRVRYRDYASWQRRWLEGEETERQMAFWKQKLADLPPLALPTDFSRPRVQSLKGAFLQAPIPPSLLPQLERLSRREGCTLFMLMLAAFSALLCRLTGQDDIPIGVPVANRTQSAVEDLIGTFVNTLVFRIDLSGNPSFGDFLSRVRAVALDAFAHQDVSFDKLVQDIKQARDTSRAPLVQTIFNMLNAPMHGIVLDGLVWEPVLLDRGGAQFELSVSIDAQITQALSVEYNTDLFQRETIERLIAQYLQILDGIVADPGMRLGSLPLLPPTERRLVQQDWNATSAFYPQDKLFIQLFEERAAERANAPALSFGATTVTYGELNGRANAFARKLLSLGIGPGAVVGLCLNRSIALVVALLAIQKAGAAYVPLDPALPSNRLEYMLSDSGAKALVATKTIAGELALPENMQILQFDDQRGASEDTSSENVAGGATPRDIAYLIYTSGSTGRPKGVAVPQSALTNFLWSMQREPGLTSADLLAAVTTVSFDIAGLELFLPLMVGARIELVPKEAASDGQALSMLLASSGASVMQATPATWRMLIEAGWQGRKDFRALCGGESLPRELADAMLTRVGEVWNMYGPTETTIWSTVCRVDGGEAPISIGRPIANTQIYIVDRGGELMPIGIPGEICIGGAGVAIGYHGRPELTAESFVPDRFSAQSDARLYRTGDLGRWGADGRLYHMGRMDHQVKIRGFRVETGEIEIGSLR